MKTSMFDRLCHKYRRFGLPRMMLYIILGNAIVFALNLMGYGEIVMMLNLNPAMVLRGELWRLVTFIFVPNDFSFFFLFWVLFYYWIGTALESFWGALKLNIFYLGGMFWTILYGFFALRVLDAQYSVPFGTVGFALGASSVNLSLFLALATLAPDDVINLFGILPIKLKWLAWFDVGLMVLPIFQDPAFVLSYAFAGAFVNYFIFFGPMLYRNITRRAKNTARAVPFKSAVRQARQAKGYTHKCAECGVTDTDAPGTEFRYCSLCSGYQCYCAAHIFKHEHRKGM